MEIFVKLTSDIVRVSFLVNMYSDFNCRFMTMNSSTYLPSFYMQINYFSADLYDYAN